MSKFGEGDLQHRPVRLALRPTLPACPLRCRPSPLAPAQGQRIGLGLYPQETPGNAQRFFWLSQLGCRCWYSRGKIMVRGQGPASIYCIGAHCKELLRPATHSLLVSPFASSWVPVFPIPQGGKLFLPHLTTGADSMRSFFVIIRKEIHLVPVHTGCQGHQSGHKASVSPHIQIH